MLQRASSYSNKILILNGWEATGKTGIANILKHLSTIPAFRYSYQLEWLLHLYSDEQLSTTTLSTLVRSEVDLLSYNQIYGREVNLRLHDQSCILKHPDRVKYIQRILSRNGHETLIDQTPLFLLTHKLYPSISTLKTILEDRLLYIEVLRDPIQMLDQVIYNVTQLYSSSPPRNFTLTHRESGLPCFQPNLSPRSDNPWSQAITQISDCYNLIYSTYNSPMSPLLLFFEDFTRDPTPSLSYIEQYTKLRFSRSVNHALRKERFPRDLPWQSRPLPIYKKVGWRDLSSLNPSSKPDSNITDNVYISKYKSDGIAPSDINRLMEICYEYRSFKNSVSTSRAD